MAETFNPYPLIGTQLTDGLDAIATAFAGGGSSVDDLVTAIYNYIQPIYYPTSGGAPVPMHLQVEIKSVAYNLINAYNNKSFGSTILYNTKQMSIAQMMLGLKSTSLTPINALDDWFSDIEDNISKAGLSVDQQTPLLLAIECAKSVYTYWVTEVDNVSSAWISFFQSTGDRNYPNIPHWIVACTEGALLGANASQKGLIAPTTDITSVNIVSTLIGALAAGAGKVIFKWVPRIQPNQLIGVSNLSGLAKRVALNIETISNLSNTNPASKPNTNMTATQGCGCDGWTRTDWCWDLTLDDQHKQLCSTNQTCSFA